jgi:hypothetical protein
LRFAPARIRFQPEGHYPGKGHEHTSSSQRVSAGWSFLFTSPNLYRRQSTLGLEGWACESKNFRQRYSLPLDNVVCGVGQKLLQLATMKEASLRRKPPPRESQGHTARVLDQTRPEAGIASGLLRYTSQESLFLVEAS